MKTKIKAIALSLALSGSINFVNAQHDHKSHDHKNGENHEHKAPHGGIVKTADKQHIELVKGADKKGNPAFTFYLLDGAEKTLANTGKTGVVMYQTADGVSDQVDLTLLGTEQFVFTGKKGTNYINLIVSIKENDKTATAKFDVKPAEMSKKEEPKSSDGHSGHNH